MGTKLKVFILILLFTFHLSTYFFPTPVLAADACEGNTIQISYLPKTFSANPGAIELTFTINHPGTLATLQGKEVALKFGTGIFPWEVYYSQKVTISGNNFKLSVDNQTLKSSGSHSGALVWYPQGGNDSSEFCSNVNYTIANDPNQGGKCEIDRRLPTELPPNSSLTVKFLGMPEKDYKIWVKGPDGGGRNSQETKTDKDGQGVFNNLTITGSPGESVRLEVSQMPSGVFPCQFGPIQIKATAAPPGTPNPGPITPGDPGVPPVDPGTPASGAGDTCANSDPAKPTIKTAIGCVPTDPVELVNAILKFALAAGGGIALLLMIWGAVRIITSSGNAEALKNGQDQFRSAVIGLLFIIFTVTLLEIIGVNILNIPGFR